MMQSPYDAVPQSPVLAAAELIFICGGAMCMYFPFINSKFVIHHFSSIVISYLDDRLNSAELGTAEGIIFVRVLGLWLVH